MPESQPETPSPRRLPSRRAILGASCALFVSAAQLLAQNSNAPANPGAAESPKLTVGRIVKSRAHANAVDSGIRLQLGAAERPLHRRTDTLAIRFKAGVDAAAREASGRRLGGAAAKAGEALENRGGNYHVIRLAAEVRDTQRFRDALLQARLDADVESADPVFVDTQTGLELLCQQEILVAPRPGFKLAEIVGDRADKARLIPCTSDQYIVPLPGLSAEEVIVTANGLSKDQRVLWAHPNFRGQAEKCQAPVPNDPLFNVQWHLENTGQAGLGIDHGTVVYTAGGTIGADIGARFAWEFATGGQSRIVAVLDNGFQLNHPDLINVVATNTGDPAGGGDQDNNGFIDDNRGWDFVSNDNNPSPSTIYDNHGTQVACTAVAEVNNGTGGAGIARGCKVLPIKVFTSYGDSDTFVYSDLASAIRYSAGAGRNPGQSWAGADVLNMSFRSAPLPVIDTALDWAAHQGRGGRGCLVVAAAGNAAANEPEFVEYTFNNIDTPSAISVPFRWKYKKDFSASNYDDAVWLDLVTLEQDLGGGNWNTYASQGFNGTTFPPAGWTRGGSAGTASGWVRSTQAGRTDGAGSAKSGAIGDNQESWIEWNVALQPGKNRLRFWLFVNCDLHESLELYVQDLEKPYWTTSGRGAVIDGIEYPASHRAVLGVGATTASDQRASYSQFGDGLDLVAPGGAGVELLSQIVTGDRTGNDGGFSGDFAVVSGTSFASPLVAGTGALMLSEAADQGFDMAGTEVGSLITATTARIGSSYTGNGLLVRGYNLEFGRGRLDAGRALEAVNRSSADQLGWVGQDITSPSYPFTFAGTQRLFEIPALRSIRTSGRGVPHPAGAFDQFRFVSQSMTGDCRLVVRVNSVPGVSNDAIAGLMIRDGTAENAKHATVALTGDGKAVFKRRTAVNGATAVTTVNSIAAPYWLRLVRTGNNVTAARSADGVTWTAIGAAITLTTSAPYRVGLVATNGCDLSIDGATLDAGTFQDLEVLGPQTVTTVAGNGTSSATGDGGPATSAGIGDVRGLAYDSTGNLYFGRLHQVRKVDAATGIISTVIGGAGFGYLDGPASTAQLEYVSDLAFDRQGRLYISDSYNKRIRRWDPATNEVSTVAGDGSSQINGDGGPAILAGIGYPGELALDPWGRVYFTTDPFGSSGNGTIRRIETDGTINHFNSSAYTIMGLVTDPEGNVYICDTEDHRILRVDVRTGSVTTVAGNMSPSHSGDGGLATSAGIGSPNGMAIAENGDLIILCEETPPLQSRVRKVDAMTGIITTYAGKAAYGYGGDGGAATSATFSFKRYSQVVALPTGEIYVSDIGNNRIRRIR